MIVIVGLGNPGKEFEKTRHNTGFIFLDSLQKKWHFPPFSFKKNLLAEISEKKINDQKIILAKPQTFMNHSGDCLKKIIKFFKLLPQNIFIVHDDLDLPLGRFKFSFQRGSAGHKGVEDIFQKTKRKDFWRLRIGIGPSQKRENFVLEKFSKEEEKILKKTIEEGLQELAKKINI